jgi:hypothetical protein
VASWRHGVSISGDNAAVHLLALLAAATATVTVDPGAGCPSSEQLTRALGALAPGLVAPAPPAASTGAPTSLQLAVVTSAEGDVRVDLVDPQGEAVLHRVLPAPPKGRAPDCPALADTIALIVDRYLRDVGYEAPPLAPPPKPAPAAPAPAAPATDVLTAQPAAPAAPPPAAAGATWRLGVVASGRRGDSGGTDADGALALAVEQAGEGPRLGARLSAGLAPAADARWTAQGASRSATLRRLPFRMGGYVAIPAGPGQLEPGVGLGADLYLVSAAAGGGQHAAPFADAALAYTMSLIKPLYLRVVSRIALTVPYDFNTLTGSRVWGTSRVYGEAGVELGLVFQ